MMKILARCRIPFSVLAVTLLGCAAVAFGQGASPAPQGKTESPSPLRSVNQALPKWLRFSGEFRDRVEGRTAFGFRSGDNDAYDLTRLRLNMQLTPTKWLRGFVQAQDARALGIGSTHVNTTLKDIFDLRQAFLEVRGGEKGHVILTVGRQELNFGAQRLIGSLDWGNTARTFDAARLAVVSENARVDVFASSVVKIKTSQFDNHVAGENFYGIYGSFKDAVPKATFEPYVLWKTLSRVRSEEGLVGDADIFAVGGRLIGKLPAGFDYAMEMARQSGHSSNDDIAAWAGYWIAGYAPTHVRLKPHFSIEYDYASGDARRGDGKVGTFDQLYPTNHAYYGIADQVGWRNISDLRTGMDVQPLPKLKANFDWHFFWLANGHDGLYNAGGALVVQPPASGDAHTDVGRELDVYLTFSPSQEVTLGAGFGHLFPGQFLKENSPGSGTSFPYAFLTYRF
jgi:alginate export protein